MLSKKTRILLILTIFTCTLVGSVNVMGKFIEPIEPPPPSPPPTKTISGYVKDIGTNAGLYNARVALFGYAFVIDMYQQVRVGVKNTNSYGYYSFTDVQADGPYSLVVTLSGYAGYSGAYRSPVYLTKLYSNVRVTGKVLESDTIENIERVNADPLTLDITPDGMSFYDRVITTTPVYVSMTDSAGYATVVQCNPTTGIYDTGTLNVRTGTIIIRAYTSNGIYTSSSTTKSFLTSTTFSNVDFELERDQGTKKVYGDIDGVEQLDNLLVQPYTFPQPLTFWIKADYPTSIVYNPFDAEDSYFWLNTYYKVETFSETRWVMTDYYSVENAAVTLWVKNHWTGDASFMTVRDAYSRICSEGTNDQFKTTFSASLGYKVGIADLPGEITASLGVSTLHIPAQNVGTNLYRSTEEVGGWRKLGTLNIDYTNDYITNQKSVFTSWQIHLDNLLRQTLKQCGAHFTFKITYEFRVNEFKLTPLLGRWNFEGDSWEYTINDLVIEHIIGDDLHTPPDISLTNYVGHSYIQCAYNPTDFFASDKYLNLLAGRPRLLSTEL